jgi:hypothetical protein
MTFIECELFHDKRRNLTFYQTRSVDCIGFDFEREFIEWVIFHDKRRDLIVYERLPVDFIAESIDGIYWRGALPR